MATFSDVFTYSAASARTMVDSDGLLKWNAHNLAINSATPATQSITVIVGADYTVECTGAGSITLSGAGTGSVTQGSPVEITATTTTLTLTVVGSLDTMWAYRSDLGGMVNNPDRTDTYVPTVASPVYLPRRNAYTYIDGVLTKAGLQFESAAATNLVTYSEDFSNAAWAKSNTTVTANAAVAPDGTTTADKLLDNTSAGVHAAQQTLAVVGGVSYTLSIYAKASEKTWFTIDPVYPSVANNITYFNLTDGTVGTNDADNTASIESVGDGWYLCRVTHTTNAAQTSMFFEVATANSDGGISYTGDGSSGVFIWGAQGEVGSTPSSYIPTAVATATRAAETLTVPIANMDYSATAMSFQMDGFMTGTSRTFADWTLDASNSILMQSGASDFTFTQEAGGVVDTVTGGSYTSGINVPFSIASRHGSTFINGAVDGTALTADLTPVALPDLSATDLSLAPTFNGYISKFLMWGQDIGDLGIAEASG